MNKKAFEFSFAWLFAILIGACILFFAIYAVTKFADSGRTESDLKLGEGIGIILNPLEMGLETGRITHFSVPAETRINNDCKTSGEFGEQVIGVSQKTMNKWSSSQETINYNKYIFSDYVLEGRKFHIFVKQFSPLFKVNDFIFLIPDGKQYCFRDAPPEIKSEIELYNKSILVTENCKPNSIKVCFSGSCDIIVNMNQKTITKNSGTVYFIGDDRNNEFLFAGIFAEKELYECQMRRTMKRLGVLSKIHQDKIQIISSSGCESNINFNSLISLINNYKESKDLINIESQINSIKSSYGYSPTCELW